MMSGIALMRSGRLALAEGTLMQLLEEFPRSAHRADAEVLLQDIRREAEPALRRNRAEETRQFDADAPEMERAPASAPPRPSRAPSE